jgi:hypothetical protein
MEQSRANKISEVLKNVSTLGKQLKKPGTSGQPGQSGQPAKIPEVKNAIGVPVEGTGFVRILMYVIAGILLIGIMLLAVDQWVTPVFQRSPGAPGYIPIPGTDTSQVFWKDSSMVKDITVGPVATVDTPVGKITPLSVTNIEGAPSYSITLDITINDEYPQDIPTTPASNYLAKGRRVFFIISNDSDGTTQPILEISLDNSLNKIYIISYNTASSTREETVVIDNVPIHAPFRIGATVSTRMLEGYLNGMLVRSKNLIYPPTPPPSGFKIFDPSNIKIGTGGSAKVLSRGISVLNVRAFGYVVSAAEMKSRMSDFQFTINKNMFGGTCTK